MRSFVVLSKKPKLIELPDNIRDSVILSNADKEVLSQLEVMPFIDPSFNDDKLKNIFQYYSLTPSEMDVEIQKYASELLGEGKVNEAWQVLLTAG